MGLGPAFGQLLPCFRSLFTIFTELAACGAVVLDYVLCFVTAPKTTVLVIPTIPRFTFLMFRFVRDFGIVRGGCLPSGSLEAVESLPYSFNCIFKEFLLVVSLLSGIEFGEDFDIVAAGREFDNEASIDEIPYGVITDLDPFIVSRV